MPTSRRFVDAPGLRRYTGRRHFFPEMDATLFIVVLVAVIFAVDAVLRWWRQNAWRRRSDDDDVGR